MRDVFEYTAKGVVGLLVPQESTTVEPELSVLLGPDVAILSMKMRNEPGAAPFDRMAANGRKIPEYVRDFGSAPIDVFGFGLTATSYILGDGEAPEQVELGGKSAPVVLAASAVKAALREAGAKKIALVSPYWTELTDAAVTHYNTHGLSVEQVVSIGPAKKGHIIYGLRGGEILEGIKAIERSGIDAIVVTGTGAPSLAALAATQSKDGLPIVSSNFALGLAIAQHLDLGKPRLEDWLSADAPWKVALGQRYPRAVGDLTAS